LYREIKDGNGTAAKWEFELKTKLNSFQVSLSISFSASPL
jgi:hypothetical protein